MDTKTWHSEANLRQNEAFGSAKEVFRYFELLYLIKKQKEMSI